jgi:hypothetical protein
LRASARYGRGIAKRRSGKAADAKDDIDARSVSSRRSSASSRAAVSNRAPTEYLARHFRIPT